MMMMVIYCSFSESKRASSTMIEGKHEAFKQGAAAFLAREDLRRRSRRYRDSKVALQSSLESRLALIAGKGSRDPFPKPGS